MSASPLPDMFGCRGMGVNTERYGAPQEPARRSHLSSPSSAPVPVVLPSASQRWVRLSSASSWVRRDELWRRRWAAEAVSASTGTSSSNSTGDDGSLSFPTADTTNSVCALEPAPSLALTGSSLARPPFFSFTDEEYDTVLNSSLLRGDGDDRLPPHWTSQHSRKAADLYERYGNFFLVQDRWGNEGEGIAAPTVEWLAAHYQKLTYAIMMVRLQRLEEALHGFPDTKVEAKKVSAAGHSSPSLTLLLSAMRRHPFFHHPLCDEPEEDGMAEASEKKKVAMKAMSLQSLLFTQPTVASTAVPLPPLSPSPSNGSTTGEGVEMKFLTSDWSLVALKRARLQQALLEESELDVASSHAMESLHTFYTQGQELLSKAAHLFYGCEEDDLEHLEEIVASYSPSITATGHPTRMAIPPPDWFQLVDLKIPSSMQHGPRRGTTATASSRPVSSRKRSRGRESPSSSLSPIPSSEAARRPPPPIESVVEGLVLGEERLPVPPLAAVLHAGEVMQQASQTLERLAAAGWLLPLPPPLPKQEPQGEEEDEESEGGGSSTPHHYHQPLPPPSAKSLQDLKSIHAAGCVNRCYSLVSEGVLLSLPRTVPLPYREIEEKMEGMLWEHPYALMSGDDIVVREWVSKLRRQLLLLRLWQRYGLQRWSHLVEALEKLQSQIEAARQRWHGEKERRAAKQHKSNTS